MSDNMKEDTSLKATTDQESETLKAGDKKQKVSQNSICEIIVTLICFIFFILVLLFALFQDKIDFTKISSLIPFKKLIPATPTPSKETAETPQKKPDKHRPNKHKKEAIPFTCKEGFYLPTDIKGKNKCLKCSLEGCSKCTGDSKHNICETCIASYTPVLNKKKKIKSCMKTCEKGDDEKCLTCSKSECGSCNVGYKLKKGKCVLNHSLKATFITNHKKENIMLINKSYINDILELFIDGQKVTPSYNHTFRKKGEHNIIMSLDHSSIISGKMMFNNLTNLISLNFTPEFGKINMVNMRGMFNNCFNLKSIELSNLKTNNVKDFTFMFNNCTSLTSINLSLFDTKKALDISYMFSNCKSLSEISLKSFVTNNVKDMTGLFYGCSSLEKIDLNKLNTQNTEHMLYMFGGCSSLKSVDISSFDTKKVKDLSYMFYNCSSLKNINLSKMNTKRVVNMDAMFMDCSSLQSADLSKFLTKRIKTANKMFYGCSSLKKLDISSFIDISWGEKDELFNKKIAKVGTIKIAKKFYAKTKNNIPKHWKIIKIR